MIDQFVMDIRNYTTSFSKCASPVGIIMFGVSDYLAYLPFFFFFNFSWWDWSLISFFSPVTCGHWPCCRMKILTWHLSWKTWVSSITFKTILHICLLFNHVNEGKVIWWFCLDYGRPETIIFVVLHIVQILWRLSSLTLLIITGT